MRQTIEQLKGGRDVKWLLRACAIYWFALFISFAFFGYEPEKFTIGCALLLASISFVQQAES